jgi:hypothetical protein
MGVNMSSIVHMDSSLPLRPYKNDLSAHPEFFFRKKTVMTVSLTFLVKTLLICFHIHAYQRTVTSSVLL